MPALPGVYQFDEARSKRFDAISTLKQTVSSPKEEALFESPVWCGRPQASKMSNYRASRGEVFSDSVPLNDKPLF